MKLQRLLSLTRQAIDNYDMIEEGDTIALGLSGGKDSLTLLHTLHRLMSFYPKTFHLQVITVDLGLEGFSTEPLSELCRALSLPFTVIPTDIGNILFHVRKESNPCALCAKLRKGIFNAKAKELGCNKVAYAHHMDDIIETMMLSLIYEGRFFSFSPKTYLDRMDLTVIRPMMYVAESDVISFKNKYQLPVCSNPCPVDGHTRREYVKQMIKQLELENPGVKMRFFHAIIEGNIPGWPALVSPSGNK